MDLDVKEEACTESEVLEDDRVASLIKLLLCKLPSEDSVVVLELLLVDVSPRLMLLPLVSV